MKIIFFIKYIKIRLTRRNNIFDTVDMGYGTLYHYWNRLPHFHRGDW